MNAACGADGPETLGGDCGSLWRIHYQSSKGQRMGSDRSLHVSRVLMGLVQWGDNGGQWSARGD